MLSMGAILVMFGFYLIYRSEKLKKQHQDGLQEDLPYEIWLEGMDLHDPLPEGHWFKRHLANGLIFVGICCLIYELLT